MISHLCTMALLTLTSFWVSEPRTFSLIITLEATSAPAVNFTPASQAQPTHRSALADTGIGDQNDTEKTRREYEKALKAYRKLAEKEPETYLPGVAATLNDLAIIDADQNRIAKARNEFENALNTYRELADKEPDIYLRSCKPFDKVRLGLDSRQKSARSMEAAGCATIEEAAAQIQLISGHERQKEPCSGCPN